MNPVSLVVSGQSRAGALFNGPMRADAARENGPAIRVVGLVGTQSERFREVALTADQPEPQTDGSET